MKKLILSISLVIVVICSFVLMSNISIDKTSYGPVKKEVIAQPLRTGGSPGGYTGSPGDGNDCTDCHNPGANYNLSSTITTDIPVTGYVFGQTYLITVAATSTKSQHGFELTAEKAGGTRVGVFDLAGATGSPELISGSSFTRVTHSNKANSSWSLTGQLHQQMRVTLLFMRQFLQQVVQATAMMRHSLSLNPYL